MSTTNAGLPNQPDKVQQSALPLGSVQFLLDYAIPITTLGDGSQWLRSGWLASAASYPAAAQVEPLKAHAFTSRGTGAGAAGTWRAVATNHSGIYLAIDDTANVWRSTDSGATWSAVVHGLGIGVASHVIWDGSKFLIIGNDNATNVIIRTSTDGSTGTWTQRLNTGVGAMTSRSYYLACSPAGNFFIAAPANATASNQVFTSTDGVNWTQRNVGNTWTATGYTGAVAVADNLRAAVVVTNTQVTATNDGGVTWNTATVGSGFIIYNFAAVGGAFVAMCSQNTVGRCTGDPSVAANWSTAAGNFLTQPPPFPNTCTFYSAGRDNVAVPVSAGTGTALAMTKDGINFTRRSVDSLFSLGSAGVISGSASDMVVLVSNVVAAAPYRYTSSVFGQANAVGVLPQFAAGNASPVAYVRIK